MELRYALIADFANATQEGKLNVMGIFDRLFAVTFPAVHRQLFLVTSIETDPEDDGQSREILIQMINDDGVVLTELKGQVNFAVGKQIFNQVHIFQDLRFENPGSYQFNVFFDGRMVKTLDLELQILPPTQTVGSA
jgi:hypothetical protein